MIGTALRKEQQRLLSWREKQQKAFHQALLEDLERNGSAAAYLRERGLSEETAKAWGLGLNSSRLMLPLRDALSRTCAFSGRSLTGGRAQSCLLSYSLSSHFDVKEV